MISTQDPTALPAIDELKTLSQSLATLDAILSPEWQFRYYSFDRDWNRGEAMASMRDGSGNHYFLLFSEAGAIMKGFAHESPLGRYAAEQSKVWPGVLDSAPESFASFLEEPAFSLRETSFCLWNEANNSGWRVGSIEYPEGDDPDGSAMLLAILDGNPATYQQWAQDYYEFPIPLGYVAQIYAQVPLNQDMVSALNQEGVVLEEIREDIMQIGYPVE